MSKRGEPPYAPLRGNQDGWQPIVCTITMKNEIETRLNIKEFELNEPLTRT
jgi:hypothetical protein